MEKGGLKMEVEPGIIDTNHPLIVCWNVISDCNLGCKFCYRHPDKSFVGTREAKLIIEKIANAGVRILSFGGGEPLLREDIVCLIRHAKSLGLTTAMDTNAIRLDQSTISQLDGFLDKIGLPLDGPTPEIHALMRRRRDHYQIVLNALGLLSRFAFQIKINTLITKLNYLFVGEIGEVLRQYPVTHWNLLEFSPVAGARSHREIFEIPTALFIKTALAVKNAYPDINIEMSTDQDRAGAYLLISPGGIVYAHLPSSPAAAYPTLGNILQDDLLEMWKSPLIDRIKHFSRFHRRITQSNQ